MPSFRIVLAMERVTEWDKPFHNAFDKLDRKKFDEISAVPAEHQKKRWTGWELNKFFFSQHLALLRSWEFNYHSELHPSKHGTIIVLSASEK
jgi:hypothetical protein